MQVSFQSLVPDVSDRICRDILAEQENLRAIRRVHIFASLKFIYKDNSTEIKQSDRFISDRGFTMKKLDTFVKNILNICFNRWKQGEVEFVTIAVVLDYWAIDLQNREENFRRHLWTSFLENGTDNQPKNSILRSNIQQIENGKERFEDYELYKSILSMLYAPR